MWKLARDLKIGPLDCIWFVYKLSLTSFLSLYKWKFSNTQHHLVLWIWFVLSLTRSVFILKKAHCNANEYTKGSKCWVLQIGRQKWSTWSQNLISAQNHARCFCIFKKFRNPLMNHQHEVRCARETYHGYEYDVIFKFSIKKNLYIRKSPTFAGNHFAFSH